MRKLANGLPLGTFTAAVDRLEKATDPDWFPLVRNTCCRWRYSPPNLKVCAPFTHVISSLAMWEGRVDLFAGPGPEVLPHVGKLLIPLPLKVACGDAVYAAALGICGSTVGS